MSNLPNIIFLILSITLLIFFIVSLKRRVDAKRISKLKLSFCVVLFIFSILFLYLPANMFISWVAAPKNKQLTVKKLTKVQHSKDFVEIAYTSEEELVGFYWNAKKNLFYASAINAKNADKQTNPFSKSYNELFFNDSSAFLSLNLQSQKTSNVANNNNSVNYTALPLYEIKKGANFLPAFGATLTKTVNKVSNSRTVLFAPLQPKNKNFPINSKLFGFTFVSKHNSKPSPEGIFFSGTRDGVFFNIFYAPHSGPIKEITTSQKKKTQHYSPYYWNQASRLAFVNVSLEKNNNDTSQQNTSNGNENNPLNKGLFVTKISVIQNPLSEKNSQIIEIPIGASQNFVAENLKLQGDPSGKYLFASDVNEQPFILVNEFLNDGIVSWAETSGEMQKTVKSYPLVFPSLLSVSSFAVSPKIKNVLAVLGKSENDANHSVYIAELKEIKKNSLTIRTADWIFIGILFGLFCTNFLLSILLQTTYKLVFLKE